MPSRRRSLSALSSLALAAASLCGCASSTPRLAPVVAPAPPPAPPPPVDVTAVPVPESLVLYGRISNPAASMKVATDWIRLPSLDPSAAVEGLLTGLTQRKADAKLAAIVDTHQPIDVAAAFEVRLPPRGLAAVAAAITNIDEARAALAASYDLRPVEGGRVLLRLRGGASTEADPETHGSDDDAACELAPAAGAAPYRLVCGSNQAALSALGPYLTRTTPRQTVPADVHLELRVASIAGFATLARMEGPHLVTGLLGVDPSTEPARADLVGGALGDLLDLVTDLDAVTLDGVLDPAHAELRLKTTFKATTSLLSRVATEHPDRVDAPPSTFWRLPADVDMATFGGPIEEDALKHPRELLVAALEEELEASKLAAGDRHALTELLRESVRGARGLVAHGEAAGAPYWVLEWDEPATGMTRVVRDAASALSRPGVLRWAASEGHARARLPAVRIDASAPWAPAGSLRASLSVPARPEPSVSKPGALPSKRATQPSSHPPSSPPDVYQLVVIPDGPRTWVAISATETGLRAAAAALTRKAGPGDLGSQAAARGLVALQDARMTSGGFFTLRGLARLAAGREPSAASASWALLVDHLPSKGSTPITVTSFPTGSTSIAAGGARETVFDAPVDAIRDAVWFAVQSQAP